MKKIKKFLAMVMAGTMLLTTPIIASAAPELVTVNPGIDPSIPVSVTVGIWNGTGDSVVQNIALPAGYSYKVTATHDGSRNFIVKFLNGDKTDYLFNKIGEYAGTVLLEDGSTTERVGGLLDIKADGAWTITISTVTNSSTRSITGTGDKVTGLFNLPNTNNVFTISNTGSRNFIVWVYHTDGKRDLLVNDIGAYSGQTVVRGKANCMSYLSITSDGTWTVDMGYGDPASVVPDIN